MDCSFILHHTIKFFNESLQNGFVNAKSTSSPNSKKIDKIEKTDKTCLEIYQRITRNKNRPFIYRDRIEFWELFLK